MTLEPQPRDAPDHSFELYQGGRRVGRLEWRTDPRTAVGWYLILAHDAPERLSVDATIDELAAATTTSPDQWALNAELAALLSVPLALDAAERRLHRRPSRGTGRFRRLRSAARYEIYVSSLDAGTLAHAIPELAVESVADVCVLSGVLMPGAFETIARRVALLGGRVLTVLRDSDAQ
jgi:hypothetical protein